MNGTLKPGNLISVALALSLIGVEGRSAEAAILTWGLTFYSNGSQVGTGEFSYDTDQVVVVKSPFPYSGAYIAGKDEPLRPDFIPPLPGLWTVTKYPNPLTSFVAQLPERTWNLGFISWFDPASPSVLGYFGCSRTSCGTAAQWFQGNPAGFAPGQFAMFNAKPLGEENYTGSFISAPIPSSPTSLVSGTWVATAVPEPMTMAGAALAGMGYLAIKKRRSRAQ